LSPGPYRRLLVFRLTARSAEPYPGHVTELPIDETAGLANGVHDATDLAVAEEALAEWNDDGRRTYRLADVDAEISES
jgi:hypothetical protein